MSEAEIAVLAVDFTTTSMRCGVMVDDFDAVGFARAIEQASRRAALEEAAKVCDKIDSQYNASRKMSDNPTYHEGKSDGAEICAISIRALYQQPAKVE